MRKISVGVLLVVVIKLFDANYIYASASTIPNQTSGKIIEIYSHSRQLFIAENQRNRLSPTHWTAILIYIVLIGLGVQKSR